jgi:phosphoenolpyruvate carboxykinase (GTP)
MAMLPFCGYNMADYWGHWLEVGQKLRQPPRIFHVNWFRQGHDGKFLWPGFGENLRVLKWVVERCQGRGQAVESPIGHLPAAGAIDTTSLSVSPETMKELLSVDAADWRPEAAAIGEFFAKFGDRVPPDLERQRKALIDRLG